MKEIKYEVTVDKYDQESYPWVLNAANFKAYLKKRRRHTILQVVKIIREDVTENYSAKILKGTIKNNEVG